MFRDNVAHSNGRYGLRIFHGLNPHENPCAADSFDEDAYLAGGDPYVGNPVVPALFENFLGYANGRNGVIGEDMGAVHFENIKVSSNGVAGFEITKLVSVRDNVSYLKNAIIVGQNPSLEGSGTPHGFIAPQRDGLLAENVRFYAFEDGNTAALGSCSHCFKESATDSGVRTTFLNQMYYHTDVPRLVRY
jgi:hypothetical protein